LSLDHKKEIYTSKPHGGPISIKSFSKAGQVGQIWDSHRIFPFSKKDTKKASKGLKIEVKSPSQGSSQGRFVKDKLLVSD
jgi:hypothetical protein